MAESRKSGPTQAQGIRKGPRDRQLRQIALGLERFECSRDAFSAEDEELASEKWQEIFGESFTIQDEDLKGGQVVVSASVPPVAPAAHARPTTEIARLEQLTGRVRIDAHLYSPTGRIRFGGINSGGRAVRSGLKIRFQASTNVAEPFAVHWQVVNTGAHAATAKALRGEFFAGRNLSHQSGNKLINWESTEFTGTHWIECFIVKDGVIVARQRFYVAIKNPEV